jgi:hypothetical protein
MAVIVPLAGCSGFTGEDASQLDLTVHNEREEPIEAQVTVVDDGGTTYADESDRIDAGVARAFDVTVGSSGRHEVTVEGADWRGQLAWNADTCRTFSGTVRITAEAVEVAGECLDAR